MKKIVFSSILLLLTLFLTPSLFGQKKVYLDEKWEKSSKKKAAYCAVVTPEAGGLNKLDVFTYPDNNKWTTGKYTSTLPELKHAQGLITWFHPNGNISRITTFVNGKEQGQSFRYYPNNAKEEDRYYENGKMEGRWFTYNEQGDTIKIKNYENDSLHGPYFLYNAGHSLKLKSNYKHGKLDGEYVLYESADILDCKGAYKDGKMQGTWEYFHLNGKIASREQYVDDSIISAEIFDEAGNSVPLKISLQELIAPPTYFAGEDAMLKQVYSGIIYPEEARENNIQGRVMVTLTVSTDGKLLSTKLLNDPIGYGLDEVSLEAANKLAKWNTFSNHNRNKPMKLNLPVKFTLK